MSTKNIDLRLQRNMLPYIISGFVIVLGILAYMVLTVPTLENLGNWKKNIAIQLNNIVNLPQNISAYNDKRHEAQDNYNNSLYQKSLLNTLFIHDSLKINHEKVTLNLAQTYELKENEFKACTYYEKSIQNTKNNYFRSIAYQQCGNVIFQHIFPPILQLNPETLNDNEIKAVTSNWVEKMKYQRKNQHIFNQERRTLQEILKKSKQQSCGSKHEIELSALLTLNSTPQASKKMRSQQQLNTHEILNEICQTHTEKPQYLTITQLINRGFMKGDMIFQTEQISNPLTPSAWQNQASHEINRFIESDNTSRSQATMKKFLQSIQTKSQQRSQQIENSTHLKTTEYLIDCYDVIMECYKRALSIYPQNEQARINYETIKHLRNKAKTKQQDLQKDQPENQKENQQQKEQQQQKNQQQNQQQQNKSKQEQNEEQQQNQQQKEEQKKQQNQQQNKNQPSKGGENAKENPSDAQNKPKQGKGKSLDQTQNEEQQAQANEAQKSNNKGKKEHKNVSQLRSKNMKYEKGQMSRAQQALRALEEREVQYLQQMQYRPRKYAPKRKKADW